MNKRSFLLLVLILTMGLNLMASSDSLQRTSLHSFELVYLKNPWLISSNPAALSQMDQSLIAIINANYLFENGAYKRVQQGDKLNSYQLNTYSFSKIKDISLYGAFNYEKSFENDLDFSNMNDPYKITSYQIIDTIGNDVYDREFFSAAGGMSKPFGNRLTIGFSGDFKVGLAAQNRDPRPQNKVFNMTLSPGIIYDLGKIKLGFNPLYKYYIEEIEIDIVRAHTTAEFFTVHGLGVATPWEATSFYRLYKMKSKGFDVQLAYENFKIRSVNGSRLLFHEEIAGDGRIATDANWAYIKKDSRYDAIQFDLYNSTSILNDEYIQSFGYMLNINTLLGIEIIQHVELIEDLDQTEWITYAEEEKYGATDIKANVYYEYFKLKSNSLKNYNFKLFADYHSFIENYYLPNQEQSYKNLAFGAAFDKNFYPHNKTLSVGLKLKYKANLEASQSFSDYTFIAEKILVPDFEYLSSNYFSPGFNIAYEIPLKKIFDQYFIKSTIDIYFGNNGQSRTIFNFSTGVTF